MTWEPPKPTPTKERHASKFPHVVFKRIKAHIEPGTMAAHETAEEFIIRLDSCHNTPSSIQNFLQDGCVIVSHSGLDREKHGEVMALLGLFDKSNIDPRLLEDQPKSALKEKVNEQRAKA